MHHAPARSGQEPEEVELHPVQHPAHGVAQRVGRHQFGAGRERQVGALRQHQVERAGVLGQAHHVVGAAAYG